ncbi:MAG TPA: hypothetical protein VFA59_16340 [Vicinamibacterales bacterium]|nr:hypothetical protein [Vicinamibacterales bacterium]
MGVLRRDGVIIPFATYDGKHWSDRWPAPTIEQSIPINLLSIPKSWWGPAGPRELWEGWVDHVPKPLRVTQPTEVDVHCTRQIGLVTDYKPAEPAPPWSEQPYPKDGLAVSPPQPVQPIRVLRSGAMELLGMVQTLTMAFNKAERETASRFSVPVSDAKARETTNPEIEVAYEFGEAPRTYYVESTRTYRTFGGADCAISFGTGWFSNNNGTVRPIAMTVDILPCDRYGGTYMFPLGAMTLGGKTYWLAQFSGWHHERFVVIELKPKDIEVVINTWGGGC